MQIGNGGATGNLDAASPIVDNGTLIFNTTSRVSLYADLTLVISGTGNVWVRSTGLMRLRRQHLYRLDDSLIRMRRSKRAIGNAGQLLSSVVTNNGTLLLTRQDNFVFGYTNNIVGIGQVVKDNNNQNVGDMTLVGTNTYTGGTLIRGGGIIIGDGVTTNAGSFVGGIVFTNTASAFVTTRFVAFNRPDDFTFSNSILSFVNGRSECGGSG